MWLLQRIASKIRLAKHLWMIIIRSLSADGNLGPSVVRMRA